MLGTLNKLKDKATDTISNGTESLINGTKEVTLQATLEAVKKVTNNFKYNEENKSLIFSFDFENKEKMNEFIEKSKEIAEDLNINIDLLTNSIPLTQEEVITQIGEQLNPLNHIDLQLFLIDVSLDIILEFVLEVCINLAMEVALGG